MRTATPCLVVAGLGLTLPLAVAGGGGTVYSGQILFSDFGTVSVFLPDCDPSTPFNGLDQYWFGIAGLAGQPFVLSTPSTLDGFIEFFDGDCDFRGGFNSKGFGQGESGNVPAGSEYALVLGYTPPGFGTFTLTIG